VDNFTYKYHVVYGSPPVNVQKCTVKGVKVSEDGLKARLVVENLKPAYIHTITLGGVKESEHGHPLLHSTAYYTLNNIPDGKKLSLSDVSVKNSNDVKSNTTASRTQKGTSANADEKKTPTVTSQQTSGKVPSFFDVKGLLVNYTCTACHTTRNKQVGPGFEEIAKRNYSNEKIVELIHNPQPQNWPDYATAMPPMPQVTGADALKIAAWINSLDD
jgi:cytochrome c551/c552